MANAVVPNMNREFQSVMDKLSARLDKLEAGPSGGGSSKRRSRSRSRGRAPAPPPRKRKSRSRGRGQPVTQFNRPMRSGAPALGTITLRGREVTQGNPGAVKTAGGHTFVVNPTIKGDGYAPSQLNGLAKLYSQVSFKSLVIEWEPMCGTTTSGAVTLAATCVNTTGQTLTEAFALSATPNVTGPVWGKQRLVVPRQYLNQKRWFPIHKDTASQVDGEQAEIVIWLNVGNTTDVVTYGRVWVSYTVEFSGFASQTA